MWCRPHLWPLCGHGCLFPWGSGLRTQGAKMWADRSLCSGVEGARQVPVRRAAAALRVCAVGLAAATLAACVQTTGNNGSAALAVSREAVASHQAAPEIRPADPTRTASSIIHRRVAVAKHRAMPLALAKHQAMPLPLARH